MAQEPSPAPPLPTPTGNQDSGASELASSIMTSLTPTVSAPSKPAAEPKPPTAPVSEPPKAPEAKPPTEPAKPAETKPEAKPEAKTINIDDPKVPAAELRKHLKFLTETHTKTLREKDEALAQVNSKIKELEAKKFWTEDDQKRFKALEEGRSTLEARLYAMDYRESPEYKKNFQSKLDEQFVEATEVVSSLSVHEIDDAGNETTRAGNQQDLLRLYKVNNLAERKKLAKEMFGEEFQEALDAVRPMIDTRKAADQAVAEKRQLYDTERKQMEERSIETNAQVRKFMDDSFAALQRTNPEVFGFSEDDKEGTEALKKGLDFVNEVTSNFGNLGITEQAARGSVFRAMAAAYPRLTLKVSKQTQLINELKSQLEALKGTDPGNAGELGGEPPAPSDIGGTESLAAELGGLK